MYFLEQDKFCLHINMKSNNLICRYKKLLEIYNIMFSYQFERNYTIETLI